MGDDELWECSPLPPGVQILAVIIWSWKTFPLRFIEYSFRCELKLWLSEIKIDFEVVLDVVFWWKKVNGSQRCHLPNKLHWVQSDIRTPYSKENQQSNCGWSPTTSDEWMRFSSSMSHTTTFFLFLTYNRRLRRGRRHGETSCFVDETIEGVLLWFSLPWNQIESRLKLFLKKCNGI